MRLVQVAEMRLVQVAEMRLVQVAEIGGGGGGGGGLQSQLWSERCLFFEMHPYLLI